MQRSLTARLGIVLVLVIFGVMLAGVAEAAPVTQASGYWTGYGATSAAGTVIFNSVTASWMEPKINCPTNEQSQVYMFVGFDGLNDGYTDSESTGVRVECNAALGVTYRTFWNHDFSDGFTVSPGDHLTATTAFVAPSFVFTVTDTTSGHHQTSTVGCPSECPRTSAEVIAGLNSSENDDDLANYGRVTFSKVGLHTSHGKTGGFSSSNWTDVRVSQVTSRGQRAKVSGLSAGGTAFTVTWISNLGSLIAARTN